MEKFIIKQGTIVDGTGNTAYIGDLEVVDGHISKIGEDLSSAGRVVDASGLIVAPGFIDSHTHTDASVYRYPLSTNRLLQGVTSEVTGSCGVGSFPVSRDGRLRDELMDYLILHHFMMPHAGITWESFADFSEQIGSYQLGTNLLPLVSHASLRLAVIGYANRTASESELQLMCELLDKQLAEGAWGMSSGLIYPPGSFADSEEFVALGKVLARYDAIYTTHIRNESHSIMEAVEESINVAAQSGCKLQISHLKSIGVPNWGKGKQALDRIIEARAQGLRITADQYPYEASATGLSVLLPGWAHEGGIESMVNRLNDPVQRERILVELNREVAVRGGPERIIVTGLGNGRLEFVGKNLAEIAAIMQQEVDQAVLSLLTEQKGVVSAVYFSIATEDIEAIIKSEIVAVGSDGRSMYISEAEHASVHPRDYGTFAKVLGEYVRDRQILSMERAIYKMTGLPAQTMGLTDRGLLQVGKVADITIFDPHTVKDMATFERPHCYAQGVRYVFVNGGLTVENGELTGNAYGRVLKK